MAGRTFGSLVLGLLTVGAAVRLLDKAEEVQDFPTRALKTTGTLGALAGAGIGQAADTPYQTPKVTRLHARGEQDKGWGFWGDPEQPERPAPADAQSLAGEASVWSGLVGGNPFKAKQRAEGKQQGQADQDDDKSWLWKPGRARPTPTGSWLPGKLFNVDEEDLPKTKGQSLWKSASLPWDKDKEQSPREGASSTRDFSSTQQARAPRRRDESQGAVRGTYPIRSTYRVSSPGAEDEARARRSRSPSESAAGMDDDPFAPEAAMGREERQRGGYRDSGVPQGFGSEQATGGSDDFATDAAAGRGDRWRASFRDQRPPLDMGRMQSAGESSGKAGPMPGQAAAAAAPYAFVNPTSSRRAPADGTNPKSSYKPVDDTNWDDQDVNFRSGRQPYTSGDPDSDQYDGSAWRAGPGPQRFYSADAEARERRPRGAAGGGQRQARDFERPGGFREGMDDYPDRPFSGWGPQGGRDMFGYEPRDGGYGAPGRRGGDGAYGSGNVASGTGGYDARFRDREMRERGYDTGFSARGAGDDAWSKGNVGGGTGYASRMRERELREREREMRERGEDGYRGDFDEGDDFNGPERVAPRARARGDFNGPERMPPGARARRDMDGPMWEDLRDRPMGDRRMRDRPMRDRPVRDRPYGVEFGYEYMMEFPGPGFEDGYGPPYFDYGPDFEDGYPRRDMRRRPNERGYGVLDAEAQDDEDDSG